MIPVAFTYKRAGSVSEALELAAEALERGRDQSDTPGEEPWPLAAWPDVDTRFILCGNDRFLPAGFMRRVVRERSPSMSRRSTSRRPTPSPTIRRLPRG